MKARAPVLVHLTADLRIQWAHHPAQEFSPSAVIGRRLHDVMDGPGEARRLERLARSVIDART